MYFHICTHSHSALIILHATDAVMFYKKLKRSVSRQAAKQRLFIFCQSTVTDQSSLLELPELEGAVLFAPHDKNDFHITRIRYNVVNLMITNDTLLKLF